LPRLIASPAAAGIGGGSSIPAPSTRISPVLSAVGRRIALRRTVFAASCEHRAPSRNSCYFSSHIPRLVWRSSAVQRARNDRAVACPRERGRWRGAGSGRPHDRVRRGDRPRIAVGGLPPPHPPHHLV